MVSTIVLPSPPLRPPGLTGNGKTTSVGGNNGGGGKVRPVGSGTDGDGRFDRTDQYRTIVPDGASQLSSLGTTREAESVSGQESMETCNAHRLCCVPLYDTLGAGAVEFIICHAEVSIAFAEEKKIPELLKTFPGAAKYLKTLVSFGNVTPEQEETLGQYGVTGTTGDPKGVLISNESIITLLAGVKRLLENVNEQLSEEDVYLSFLPLAHIFDRVIEELFIWTGAQIGFWA
ncbi:hypothetical protein EV1_031984 [Malus domestica]